MADHKMTLRQSLRDTALPIFLALWMALTPAFAGSMMLLGVGGGSAALPGPPSATFQSPAGSGVNSTNTTVMSLTLGTAFSTRIIAVMIPTFGAAVAQTITGAVFVDGANNYPASSFGTLATAAGNASVVMYVVGAVPTGTAVTLTITFTTTVSASFRFGAYAMDSSQMVSTTPTTYGANVSAAATSNTLNLTVPTSGSVVLAADAGNNVTKTFSGSPTMTKDIAFNATVIGHANSVASGSPSLTVSWTPAAAVEAFGALQFR